MDYKQLLFDLQNGLAINFSDGDDVKSFYKFANIQGDTLPNGNRIFLQLGYNSSGQVESYRIMLFSEKEKEDKLNELWRQDEKDNQIKERNNFSPE